MHSRQQHRIRRDRIRMVGVGWQIPRWVGLGKRHTEPASERAVRVGLTRRLACIAYEAAHLQAVEVEREVRREVRREVEEIRWQGSV